MKIKKIFFIALYALFIWAPQSSLVDAKTGPGKFIITFIIGQVEISRGGSIVTANNGDAVQEGDIIRLKEKSVLELTSGDGETACKISGPAIFRFNPAGIAARIKRAGLLYSLMMKLSAGTVHYSPRTIVTAVRGKDDPAKESAAAEKMKEAMSLYHDSKYDEAWKALEELSAMGGLKKHTENLISFYQAEILFIREDFAGALALYVPLHLSRIREFRHREICLGKAIICAAHEGDEDMMKKLAARYKEEYSESGTYYSVISALMRE